MGLQLKIVGNECFVELIGGIIDNGAQFENFLFVNGYRSVVA